MKMGSKIKVLVNIIISVAFWFVLQFISLKISYGCTIWYCKLGSHCPTPPQICFAFPFTLGVKLAHFISIYSYIDLPNIIKTYIIIFQVALLFGLVTLLRRGKLNQNESKGK